MYKRQIYSFLSRWTACTELCAGTQEEPCGKKSSMGSENRQRCSPRLRKSALMRSVPPRFDRAARKTRRALAASLRLSCCRGCGKFSLSGRYRRVLKAARSNLGGNKCVTTDFRLHLKLFWRFSLPIEPFLPLGSSCLSAQSSVPAPQRDRNECIALTDRPCLLSKPISRTQLHSRRSVLSYPATGETLP